MADVGVHVERTVGWGHVDDPRRGEPVEQQLAVRAISRHVPIELGRAFERGERRHLADVRGADVQVLLQAFDGVGQVRGNEHPAEPPTRHREVLGEAVDHDGVTGEGAHGVGPSVEHDAVVDLVGDQLHLQVRAPGDDLGKRSGVQHCAGGVGRRRDDKTVEWPGRFQQLGGRRPSGGGIDGNRDRLDTECEQGVAVARVTGLDHADAVAVVERCRERERETGRRAADDKHLCRVDIDGVPVAVVAGDPPAKAHQPAGVRVPERLARLQRPDRGESIRMRRGCRWLADFEVKYRWPRGLTFARPTAHRHCMKRWNGCGSCRLSQGHSARPAR